MSLAIRLQRAEERRNRIGRLDNRNDESVDFVVGGEEAERVVRDRAVEPHCVDTPPSAAKNEMRERTNLPARAANTKRTFPKSPSSQMAQNTIGTYDDTPLSPHAAHPPSSSIRIPPSRSPRPSSAESPIRLSE